MSSWDDRSGGDRGRDQGQSNWNRDRDYGRRDYPRDQGRNEGHGGRYGGGSGDGGHDDRGFFDRAGDELRSWFGDDDAQRRREADQRRWEQEQRMTGARDNDSGPGSLGGGGFGGGWGNQRAESWNRERPGERGWAGASAEDETRGGGGGERHYARGEREGWFSDSIGGERGHRHGGHGGGYGGGQGNRQGGSFGGGGGEHFRGAGMGASGEGGDRFGRVDFGSRGSQRGRASSAPLGGGFDSGFGPSGGGRVPGYGSGGGGQGPSGAAGIHDPHYSEWRRRQIEDLDRDYDEYRREHQSKFENEFGSWRSKRQGQRQALNQVAEHMEVVGSDGSHVGTVDKVRGDRIVLAKSDPNAGGVHHSVPCSWVETVGDKVMLNKSGEEAITAWRTEDRGRALFEREGSGSEGPHNLDRAFSGTYPDRDRDGDRDRERSREAGRDTDEDRRSD